MSNKTKKFLVVAVCIYLAEIIVCLSIDKSRKMTEDIIKKCGEIERCKAQNLKDHIDRTFEEKENERLQKSNEIIKMVNEENEQLRKHLSETIMKHIERTENL